MKRLVIILLFWGFSSLLAKGQGIYKGGSGGGWSTASLKLGQATEEFRIKILTVSGRHVAWVDGIPAQGPKRWRIFDCLGRQIEQEVLAVDSGEIRLTQGYSKGIYLLVIETESITRVKKIFL